MKSVLNNIASIYFFRFLSMFVSFLSMVIVLPRLVGNSDLYAAYAVLTSLSLYLSYGDLGFLSACQKFCGEALAKDDTESELECLGFTITLMIVIFLLFTILMLLLYNNIELVFPSISEVSKPTIASLIFYMAMLLPVQTIIQRINYLILTPRLKDYLFTRADVFCNLTKVVMAPVFFAPGEYRLVEYFVVGTLLSLAAALVGLLNARNHIKYRYLDLVLHFRFSRPVFEKLKRLAIVMFASSFGFALYYEMDLIIAAQFFSMTEVANLAVILTLLNYVRTVWVTIFSPFFVLLNELVAKDRELEIRTMCSQVLLVTAPMFVFLSVAMMLFCMNIVITWVGEELKLAGVLGGYLFAGLCLAGFGNVATHLATSRKSYMQILGLTYIPLISYYFIFAGFFFFELVDGVLSIVLAKACSLLMLAVLSVYWLRKDGMLERPILSRYVWLGLAGLALFIFFKLVAMQWLPVPEERSLGSFFIVISYTLVFVALSTLIFWCSFADTRKLFIETCVAAGMRISMTVGKGKRW